MKSYSLWISRCGNGIISRWIWSWSCRGLLKMLMQFGSTSICWPRVPLYCYSQELLSREASRYLCLRVGFLPWCTSLVVSNRDFVFTSRFWKWFHKDMGTQLHFSITYHPQNGGQSERTIKTLEDMLRGCVIDFGGSWGLYLPLVEFSYNNNFHSCIGISPFKMFYGRKCRTTILLRILCIKYTIN